MSSPPAARAGVAAAGATAATLIRRNRRTGELALYRCYSARRVPLARLVKVAALRWTVDALAVHAQPPPAGLIPLTRDEIARLAAGLITCPVSGARHQLRWSAWRRRH